MRINQNIAALNAYRNLSNTDNRLNRSLERLSSGMRINRAADDAAGLAISEKMRAQIRGLGMSLRNAQDGVSLIQTAEGAIQEVHTMLQRMRELAVQAANETYTSADRMEIQKEIEQLKDEINRVASSTEFNTRKLLDGSGSAIVSTDSPDTHVYMRDGLRFVDQFGQKVEGGGNFRIDINAEEIGAAQVQKSNIFMVKHEVDTLVWEDVAGTDEQLQAALNDVDLLGEFNLTLDHTVAAGTVQAPVVDAATQASIDSDNDLADGAADFTASPLVFYVEVDGGPAQTITLDDDYTDAAGVVAAINNQLNGATASGSDGNPLTIISDTYGGGSSINMYGSDLSDHALFNVNAYENTGDDATVTITVGIDDNVTSVSNVYNWLMEDTQSINLYPDAATPETDYTISDLISLRYDNDNQVVNADGGEVTTSFTESGTTQRIGDLATNETRLYDIREFWDANGRFLLENPRTITIVQGDGEQTFFTIDQNDTLGTLQDKINKAIGDEDHKYLGQNRYLASAVENQFVHYVTEPSPGHLSTRGTMVVRSVVPGRQGELSFFGDNDLINALGFQTIQNSTETIFNIDVRNAHTEEVIDENVRISSNLLVGIVHPHVDVEFDPLAGMAPVVGFDDNGAFDLQIGDIHQTFIHLKDSTMVFQIGPNPGQDVGAAIGRLDSRALGIHGVLVTDRLKANNAIDFIDRAMNMVSSQRSKLGAIQNRLEHTINSLMVASENLTAAESRIRDLDLAEEMVNFTKDQILMQAGTAMLAQANMKPQSILQLLG